jgi:hypothetical protein
MTFLDFETSLEALQKGKLELVDIAKSCLWQHAPKWFDILDFEDDAIFLEPTLFYHFSRVQAQEKCVPLEQIFYGFSPKDSLPSTIQVLTDPDGVIYLPKIGYITTHTEGVKELTITFCDDNDGVILNGQKFIVRPIKLIKNKQFILSNYKSDIYREMGVDFIESISDSVRIGEKRLVRALNRIEQNIPDFYEAIKMTTSEYAIFNSRHFQSFAAIHHFGTAFLNLGGQNQSEVFFLDDVAHQCGHTMYYALTHDATRFLKPNRFAKLKAFSGVSYDERGVYGAFHGLFTYTTTLHCLNIALKDKWFEGEKEDEALARLGFYYKKFEMDLSSLGDSRVLTEEGWRYYDMFQSGFNKIKKDYHHIVKYFDFSNQDYDFNFQKFQALNQFQTV